jgi:hypothetical protein
MPRNEKTGEAHGFAGSIRSSLVRGQAFNYHRA